MIDMTLNQVALEITAAILGIIFILALPAILLPSDEDLEPLVKAVTAAASTSVSSSAFGSLLALTLAVRRNVRFAVNNVGSIPQGVRTWWSQYEASLTCDPHHSYRVRIVKRDPLMMVLEGFLTGMFLNDQFIIFSIV
jgi:hypothetical protein